tara:strand:- start:3458 stop:3844 length:387 start_codon:yes stop_codon:yes gene_type:complete
MTTERIPKCPECERDMVFEELSEEYICEACNDREREAKSNARALSPLTPEESFPGHPGIASMLREKYMKKAFETAWFVVKENTYAGYVIVDGNKRMVSVVFPNREGAEEALSEYPKDHHIEEYDMGHL